MWGLWPSATGDLHVVPCDREGHVLGGHECSEHCFCSPRPDEECPELMIHNDHKRSAH